MDEETITNVTWESYAHYRDERSGDWYWIVSIITISLTVAILLFSNTLLAILVLLSGGVIMLVATKDVPTIPYAITTRGVRINDRLYPYSTLESYFISEENEDMPMLLVKSQRWLMPLLTLPLPSEYIDEIEELISARLPEEPMEEPLIDKFLELLGI